MRCFGSNSNRTLDSNSNSVKPYGSGTGTLVRAVVRVRATHTFCTGATAASATDLDALDDDEYDDCDDD